MRQPSDQILIANAPSEYAQRWRSLLVAKGWQVRTDSLDNTTTGELKRYDVVVLFADNPDDVKGTLVHNASVNAGHFLPVLEDATGEDVLGLIRSGITDVLLLPVPDQEILEAIERVALTRNLYEENRSYRRKLERKNKELNESLNILKMDQIAGRQVQKNLMPNAILDYQGYTVSYKIIPSLYLSGDFVAYNLVFDRYIVFYIADVSGHGASSAFVTILLRFILKRILRKHLRKNDLEALSHAPQGFIEHVNRQLLATGLEKQLTMFAGVIDTKTNRLRYSVAAQVPMPILLAEGNASFLGGKGKVVGLFEEAQWQVYEMPLPNTFELVMVSDGLLEILPGQGLEAKEDILTSTLKKSVAGHDGICEALGLNDVSEAIDDISILTICRREPK